MKASVLYRIAAVLLVLFAAAHTLGFNQSDPQWGVDALITSMHSIHFDMLGVDRTYWDFFMGAGLCVGVFYLFAATLAWQLGGLPAATLALMRGTSWVFALCFAAITAVSSIYLFIIPVIFSAVITVCLTAAAWLAARPGSVPRDSTLASGVGHGPPVTPNALTIRSVYENAGRSPRHRVCTDIA